MNLRTCFFAYALAIGLAGAVAIPALVQADGIGNRRRGDLDFGAFRDRQLRSRSLQLFGINGPLDASSTSSIDAATAEAQPLALMKLASSLRARVVASSADLGADVDMMVLWPVEQPTHLIVCNEGGVSDPAVQRVRLADGQVETLLTGMESCDPAHPTPWGTIVVGEEAGSSGSVLEIIEPLSTTGVIYDRETGALSGDDAGNVAVRPAFGHLSFEGIGILPNGVTYYGDEKRPFQGVPGGAYFKFIPAQPWSGGAPIDDLASSPLVDGHVYGLRLGLRSGATDYGQGSNTGFGAWVEIADSYDANLQAASASLKLTGYYRPEDLALDGSQLAKGNVRFCSNNTGNEAADGNWGEAICVTDGTVDEALANTATPEVQLLVVGTPQLAMMDNLAFQPGRGNWILHEDGDQLQGNNDLWSCLDDGNDSDELSDGCVRIATLRDLEAEWTGGLFDATGERFFVSLQHNVTGHGVVIEITGWQ